MDAHAAQLRHQIDATRAALDAKVTQLEQRVSQMPTVLLEQHVLGPVRGVQDTAARATTLLSQYSWLILWKVAWSRIGCARKTKDQAAPDRRGSSVYH